MSLLFVVYGGDVVRHCCLWYRQGCGQRFANTPGNTRLFYQDVTHNSLMSHNLDVHAWHYRSTKSLCGYKFRETFCGNIASQMPVNEW